MSDTGTLCPNCGAAYKQFSKHKCKGPGAAGQSPASDTGHLHECQKYDKLRPLELHKRKSALNGTPSSHSIKAQTDKPALQISSAVDLKSSLQHICSGCRQEFKRLSQHKCKAVLNGTPSSHSTKAQKDGPALQTSSVPDSNGCAKKMSSGCGKEFERLSQHKCKAVLNGTLSSHSTKAQKDKPALQTSSAVDLKGSLQHVCSGCGQEFKRLSQHVCKGRETKSAKAELVDEKKTSAASSRPTSSGDSVRSSMHKRSPQHTKREAQSAKTDPAYEKTVVKNKDDGSKGYQAPSFYRSMSFMTTSSLDDEAEALMDELKLQHSSDPKHTLLEFFKTEVKLDQKEKDDVSKAFKKLRDKIMEELQNLTKWSWEHLNSGSYYDGTKVTRADEYDCMLIPAIPVECLKVNFEKAPPGYCFVEFDRSLAPKMTSSDLAADQQKAMDNLDEWCGQRKGVKVIRSDRFREQIHKIIGTVVSRERKATVDLTSTGSPSFTVNLKAIPKETGLDSVSIDFVPALHLCGMPPGTDENLKKLPKEDRDDIMRVGFDVTPKQYKGDDYTTSRNLLWRLSFSRAEKRLTKYADLRTKAVHRTPAELYPTGGESRPTCKKEVLRILKRLLEIIKGFDNSKKGWKNPVMINLYEAAKTLRERSDVKTIDFSSFEIRNLVLWIIYINCPGPEEWTMDCRRQRVQYAFKQLKKMLKGSTRVPHFFLPHTIPDIISKVPQKERDFLYIMFTIAEKLL